MCPLKQKQFLQNIAKPQTCVWVKMYFKDSIYLIYLNTAGDLGRCKQFIKL
jgi:hypothetical protein